jgi:hypothetical protein
VIFLRLCGAGFFSRHPRCAFGACFFCGIRDAPSGRAFFAASAMRLRGAGFFAGIRDAASRADFLRWHP